MVTRFGAKLGNKIQSIKKAPQNLRGFFYINYYLEVKT